MDISQKVVIDFIEAWADGDFRAVFENFIHDDCVWHNTGLPSAIGKAQCIEFILLSAKAYPRIEGEILASAVNGDTVFVQRTDRPINAALQKSPPLDITGVFKVRDGKIVYWHDYFDPRPYLNLFES